MRKMVTSSANSGQILGTICAKIGRKWAIWRQFCGRKLFNYVRKRDTKNDNPFFKLAKQQKQVKSENWQS